MFISKIKNLIIVVILIIMGCFGYYQYQILSSVSQSSEKINFNIVEGEGVHQISNNLLEQKIIKSSFWFETYVWQKDLEKYFVAGGYELSPNMNIKQIVKMLTNRGNSETDITIIEGWNNQEIAKYLEDKGFGTQTDFLNLVGKDLKSFISEYEFLADKPENIDLEGYLFPDTYRVYKNASQAEIVKKMLNNFDRKLTSKIRADLKAQSKTIFQVITLASIIEKEVRSPEDMKMVADIFWKRLSEGMALQSDATVNYVTGKKTDRPSANDLKIDSLYNTYKYKGLPPGPITNPGLNAINAAIYPTANQYFYFLTTKDGQVIYSKNYQEHLKNKQKYLSN